MNKEQQIEEIMLTIPQKIVAYNGDPKGQHLYGEQRQQIAEALYNAGYRKTFTSDFASDTQKAYKDGYEKGVEETKAEIEILKIQNKNLEIAFDRLNVRTEKLEVYNDKLSQGIYFGNGEQFSIAIEKAKQKAVKEFAEKIKGKLQDFGDGGEKGAYITEKDIDEKLKEYEK